MNDKIKSFLGGFAGLAIFGALIFGPALLPSTSSSSQTTEAVHVAPEPTCETQEIVYEEVEQETEELEVGDNEVTQKGVNGARQVCTNPETNTVVSDEITSEPVSQITRIGTYEPPVYSEPAYGSICNDGSWSPSTGRGTCSWHDGVSYEL